MALQILKRRFISHRDMIGQYEFGSLKMPKLKGHVKVTLHNCRTGKNEVAEGENIVTNALADILANNYLGSIDTGSLLPIYSKWFGGILVYKEPHTDTTDPTDYFIKGNNVNELIAHAGDTAPGTAQIIAEDLKRGSPLSEIITENSIKRTWEWGSSQGNGQISALSLTHKDTGNAGTGCGSSAFQEFQPFASIGNLSGATININCPDDMFARYDDYHGLWFHIGEENEFYNGHSSFETQKLTVIIRRLPYAKVGLRDTLFADSSYSRTFTVELSDFSLYNQPSYYFDYTNKKLWIFSNTTRATDGYNTQTYDNTNVNYAIIDCENESIDSEGVITSDTSDLAPVSMEKYPNRSIATDNSRMRNANIIKDGNYVYLPTTNGVDWGSGTGAISRFNVKGFRKININNQSDQTDISLSEVQTQFKSAFKIGGLIVNSGKVINGGVGYTCASQLSEAETIPSYAIHEPYKVSSLVTYLGAGNDSGSQARYILANKLVNTTLFNLNSAVQKTTAKSMQIEYTLTEVSGND